MVRAPFRQVCRFIQTSELKAGRFRVRMAEDDPDTRRLNELERKLKRARGAREPEPAPESREFQLGVAFRLVAELVVAVVVGGAIGWALDRVFRTSPILLIVFFFLGVAAGFRNVLRAAREMNKIGADKD